MTNCIDETEKGKGVPATFVWHLFVDCPHCKGQVDIIDFPDDEG